MEIPGRQLVCYLREVVWYLKGPWGTGKKQARERVHRCWYWFWVRWEAVGIFSSGR